MFFSRNWIKQYLPDLPELPEVAKLLNESGLETEVEDEGVEVEHTVNRPDAMCHYGLARELAVKAALKMCEPEIDQHSIDVLSDWTIETDLAQSCPRYIGLLIEGVRASASPQWLTSSLEAIGQTSHNLLVDLTNYLLWEFGHPCHAFDADRILGQRIVIRNGENKERLTTLDGRDHQADGLLCIADESRPIAFAGVMGGENTEVHEHTSRLLLELACFDPVAVRQTGRATQILSDARHRFERGIDPENMERVIRRFIFLLKREQPDVVVKGWVDMNHRPFERKPLILRESRLKQVLGIQLSNDHVNGLLERMDFRPQRFEAGWQMTCPGYKVDVAREIDVIEEVIRFSGLELLDTKLPTMAGSDYDEDSVSHFEYQLLNALRELGLQEVRTYSFLNEAWESCFSESGEAIKLKNPMSDSQAVMRRLILPNLVETVARNARHGSRNLQLFESGHVYLDAAEPHHLAVAFLLAGDTNGWWQSSQPHPLHSLKGIIEALVDRMGWKNSRFKPASVSYLTPGLSLAWEVGGTLLGHLGILSESIADKVDLEYDLAVFECQLDPLRLNERAKASFDSLAPYPGVQMDVAFVVERKLAYAEIEAHIQSLQMPNLESFSLFDVYEGKSLAKVEKSLGFRFRFRCLTRTLTHEEVSEVINGMVDSVCKRFNAVVRQ